MNMNDLEQLAPLDPARGREPSVAEWSRSYTQVERVLAGRQSMTPAHARRSVVGRLGVGAVAVAAAVAAAAAVPALLPGSTDKALAAWTAVPANLTGEQVMPQAQQCAKQGGGTAPANPSDVLLAEQRGIATLLIMKRSAGSVECMTLGPDETSAAQPLLAGPPTAPVNGLVSLERMSSLGSGDEQYSQVVGLINASVTGVDVVLYNGTVIHASRRSGWFAAWWPGPEGGEADALRIVVHTAAGDTTYRPADL
jgi:hypothetical protein